MSFGVVLHWVLIIALAGNILVWGSIGFTYVFILIRNRFCGGGIRKQKDFKENSETAKKEEIHGLH